MKYTFNSVNQQGLISMSKSLLTITNSLYLKLSENTVSSDVFNPGHDVIKNYQIATDLLLKGDKIQNPIKVGFFEGKTFIDILSHFGPSQLIMDINFQKLEETGEYFAESVVLRDDSLKMTLPCLDPSLSFLEIPTEVKQSLYNTSDEIVNFELSADSLTKIQKLIEFDNKNTDDILRIYGDKSGIHFAHKNFDFIASRTQVEPFSVSTYKRYLSLVDKSNYNVSVGSKIVFVSENGISNLVCNLIEE